MKWSLTEGIKTILQLSALDIKAELRKQMILKRNALDQETIDLKSEQIGRNLLSLELFKGSRNILFFMSMEKEAQTRTIMNSAISMGKQIYLPIVETGSNKLLITAIPNLKIEFKRSSFGILEPSKTCWNLAAPESINIVVSPGLAFDVQGGRLGFGKGYYDALFASLLPKTIRIGVAFDFQLVEEVPQEPHDEKVHLIVTEKRTVECHSL